MDESETTPAPPPAVIIQAGAVKKAAAGDGEERPASTRKQTAWWRHPSTLLIAALALLLLELVLVRVLGWWWALGFNAGLAGVVLLARSTWPWSRGSGSGRGLLGRLTGGARGRAGSGSPASVSSTGSGRGQGLLSRLIGGRLGGGSGPRAGGGSPKRGLLSRLGSRGGSPAGGSPRRGLLSRLTGKGSPRGGSGAGGWRSPGRGLLGRLTGRPTSGAAGRDRAGSGSPAGRRTGATAGGATGAGRKGKPASGTGGGGLAAAKDAWKAGTKGATILGSLADGLREGWAAGGKKDKAPGPNPGTANEQTEEKDMSNGRDGNTGVWYDPDAHMASWANVLATVPNLIDESAVRVAAAEEAADAIAGTLTNLASHGGDGLPANEGLVAEVEILAGQARAVQAEIEASLNALRRLGIESESLRGHFEAAHDGDIGRWRGERAPRHIEAKADVSTSEIDY